MSARTIVERTETLPNHTSMLTGRRLAGPRGTSVRFNEDNGSTLEQVHGSYVPGIFDVAHDHGLRTALFAQKDKFEFLLRSWDAEHGAPDTVGRDDGRDKVDVAEIDEVGSQIEDVRRALAAGADLVFWHLRAPDSAGHRFGWAGREYLSAVLAVGAEVAAVVGPLLDAPRSARPTYVVLTADHGGDPGTQLHGDEESLDNARVPFVVAGPGVAGGADLYALNPSRQEPGEALPGYAEAQPIRNLDSASVVLDVLGLPPLVDSFGATVPVLRLR